MSIKLERTTASTATIIPSSEKGYGSNRGIQGTRFRFVRTQKSTRRTWISTKNMLPAKPAMRSLARSNKVLCSKNSCSCLAMESICDCVCVEFSLIKPLFSRPSDALPATQVLFPFLIKSDEDCGDLLTGRLSVQTERGVLDTRDGSVAGRLPPRSPW